MVFPIVGLFGTNKPTIGKSTYLAYKLPTYTENKPVRT